MRIAFYSDNLYPELSGIVDSILTTGEELRKRGHSVVYAGPWYPKKAYKEGHSAERDKLPTKRLPSLPMPNAPTGQTRIVIPSGASLRFLAKFQPDIIHTQTPYGAGLEALFTSWFLGVPLVGTNHTPIGEFVHYVPFGKQLTPLARRFDAWYYNRCRFVSAPYQGLIDEMRTVGFKRNGKAVSNPVPHMPRLPKNGNGKMILCSGRLAPEKQVDVILQAFGLLLKSMPDAELVVTGRGAAEAGLKKLAQDLGIDSRVKFVGFVVADELAKLYASAALYVIMSTAETQSLSLMQAFANKVPAIAARSRGLIDYTGEGRGFLVTPGNAKELAERMEEILRSKEKQESMGNAGATFVEKLTPEKIAETWENMYKEVLA